MRTPAKHLYLQWKAQSSVPFRQNKTCLIVNLNSDSSLCLKAEVKASVLEEKEVLDTKTVQREERCVDYHWSKSIQRYIQLI